MEKLLEEEQYDEIRRLASLDKRVVPKLIHQVGSRRADIRERASKLLGEMSEPRAIPALMRLIERSANIAPSTYTDELGLPRRNAFYYRIRSIRSDKADVNAAAKAVEEIMYAPEVEPLIIALKDDNTEVREKSVEVFMGRRLDSSVPHTARVIETLIAVSKQDKNPMVRRNARLALRNQGSAAVEPLIVALKDKDEDQRFQIAWTLYWLWDTHRDKRIIEPLLAALDNKDLAVVAGAYNFFVLRGKADTESVLIEALGKHGNMEMALHFLNCGNNKLAEAAKRWATIHGFRVNSTPHRALHQPLWGSRVS